MGNVWVWVVLALVEALILGVWAGLEIRRRSRARKQAEADEARRLEAEAKHAVSCAARVGDSLAYRSRQLEALEDLSICQNCRRDLGDLTCGACGVLYDPRDLDMYDPVCLECGELIESLRCGACGDENAVDLGQRRERWQGGILEETWRPRVFRVLLSTGGPGDWFDLEVDDRGDVVGAEYVFQDWYDYAYRQVTDSTLDDLCGLYGDFQPCEGR